MSADWTTAVALVGLAASLAAAVARPRWAPEAAVASIAAVLVLVTGGVGWGVAGGEVRDLLPVVGFLVAVLVLAHLLALDGLFDALGARVGRAARGDPIRLFTLVFVLAAATTVVLSLDTTVVLLAPVVLVTVARARVRAAPYSLLTVHLANSGSLLLPVSNLSNLLVVAATGLGFVRFTALMLAPAVVALAVEFVGLRWLSRRELAAPAEPAPPRDPSDGTPDAAGPDAPVPVVASVVLGATLLGFVVCGALGIEPVWPAAAGAAVLVVRALRAGRTTARDLVAASSWDFAVFVLGIGVVVAALTDGPVGRLVGSALPAGDGLLALLGVAAVAAILANLVNNLPATLLVVGLLGGAAAGGGGPLPVLAALVGLNVGPNLTYPGSLATLLWRRLVPADARPGLRQFTVAGLVTVPAGIALSVLALWAAGHVVG